MVHIECINLPQFINTNRHDHRISRASHPPLGNWDPCGVCRQNINCEHGVFTCSRCPSYVVHSKCATREDVWDGKELEEEPKEEEIEPPFKAINEIDIIHFSHEEHILRLGEDDANMRCDGCAFAINDDPFYKCVECDFYLHKTCANLPRKKGHFLHNHNLALLVDNKSEDSMFGCSPCQQFSNGFRYKCGETNEYGNECLDCSIPEPFHHEFHPHPLYRISKDHAKCHGCNKFPDSVLSCLVFDNYVLGMECATLPRKVKHKCDDHFLTLCQGVGNAKGNLWCDICETKTDPSVWYYTCEDCGVTLHVKCVLGDLYYLKEGVHEAFDFKIFPNNGSYRHESISCKSHCKFLFYLKCIREKYVVYFCSFGSINVLGKVLGEDQSNEEKH